MITPEELTITKALRALASRVRSLELAGSRMAYGFYTSSFTSVVAVSTSPASWTYVEGASPVTPVGGTFRVDVEGIYLVEFGVAATASASGRSYPIINASAAGRIALTPIPSGERNATTVGMRHLLVGDIITPALFYTSAAATNVVCEFAVTLLAAWPPGTIAPPTP